MMRTRTMLVLFLLVLAAGLFFALVTVREEEKDYARRELRLFPEEVFRTPILKIRLQSGEQQTLLFRHADDEDWRVALGDDRAVRADGEVVRVVLERLRAMRAVTALEAKYLSAYGLTNPVAEIEIVTASGAWTLRLGGRTATRSEAYAQATALPGLVCVVPPHASAIAALNAAHLRTKAITALNADSLSKVLRITISRPDHPPVVCERADDGWRLTSPVADRARAHVLQRFLAFLASVRLNPNDFLAAETPVFSPPPAPPTAVVSFSGDGIAETLTIGAESADGSDRFHAGSTAQPSAFLLDRRIVAGLCLSAADLRARDLDLFAPHEATAVGIRADGREALNLLKSGGRWALMESPGVTPAPDLVHAFLDEVRLLHVTDWIDDPDTDALAAAGLDAPQASVVVTLQSGRALRFDFSPPRGDGLLCAARVDKAGPIRIVPAGILRDLSRGTTLFVSRRITDFRPQDIRRLEVFHAGARTAAERTERGWRRSTEPATSSDAVFGDLAWMLCQVESKRMVVEDPEDFATLYGLDKPAFRVVVTLATVPATSAVLLIGKEAGPAENYAAIEGTNRVHVIGDEIARQLARLMTP